MPGKPVKTETIVRQYDANDDLVSETTTVQTITPVQQDSMNYGMYL